MIRDTLENLGNKIPPFFRKPEVFLLALFIIFCIYSGIIFIYGNFFAVCNGCDEVKSITYQSNYGYFNVDDFDYSLGNNDKYKAKKNGELYPVSYAFIETIPLAYNPGNKTWSLVNPIDDVIHFNITNPDTGNFIKGNFTPNRSIVNNNFYSDFLIVNWRDADQKGSCYQINEGATSEVNGSTKRYSLGIVQYKYEKPLGINQYDEIRTNISLALTPGVVNGSRVYEQKDVIVERSCTGPYSEGNNFAMLFSSQNG